MRISKKVVFLIFLVCFAQLVFAQSFARWYTSMGTFRARIREDLMPITGTNFVSLASSNFYDGLIFHRVAAGFVIQDGCPLGTGTGGPGYSIDFEYHPDMNHDGPGAMGMARSADPNSGGSQYYFTLDATPGLDGNYAVFGKIWDGLDVVLAIGQVATTPPGDGKPDEDVNIDSVRVLNLHYSSCYPEESDYLTDTGVEIPFMVVAYGYEEEIMFKWFINDEEQVGMTEMMFPHTFTADGQYDIKCLAYDSEENIEIEWVVQVGEVDNNDEIVEASKMFMKYPNPFTFTEINRGPDAKISYYLPTTGNIKIDVYNVKGQFVKNLVNDYKKSGDHEVYWNGTDTNGKNVASGLYFYHMKSENERVINKAILIK